MWKIINTDDELSNFMDTVCHFHDSCIKELTYLSGAYVDNDLSMYPINNRRLLRVIIQRQSEKNSMIEMEFHGLKYIKLVPADENYTCEILDSTMFKKNGNIYWCDCGGLSESDLNDFRGTIICASSLQWRSIENKLGKKEFYHSDV